MKRDKYLNPSRELKRQWNKVFIIILFNTGILGTVPENLGKTFNELKIKVRIETIQTKVLLKLTKVHRRILKI